MTWQEELHPRDDAGRFAPSEGGGAWTEVRESADLPAKDRAANHERIRGKTLASGIASGSPRVTMLGGGPAAGKSEIVKSGFLEQASGSVTIDPDEMKRDIPEFRQMVNEGGEARMEASSFVHEEASALSKEIRDEAIRLSYPVTFDTTGDGSFESLEGKVRDMRATYADAYPDRPPLPIDAVYVTRDVEDAVAGARERFERTGRFVPEAYQREVYAQLPTTVSHAVDERLFDDFRLYASEATGPRLIAEYRDRGEVQVYDQAAWRAYYVGTG